MIDPFVSGVYAGDPSKLAMRHALKKIHNLEAKGQNAGLLSGGLARQAELLAERKSDEFRAKWREGAELMKARVQPGALGSFKKGLQALPRAVAAKLGDERVALGLTLRKIGKAAGGGYTCTFAGADGSEVAVGCRAAALTIPSHAYGEILQGLPGSEALMAALNSVRWVARAHSLRTARTAAPLRARPRDRRRPHSLRALLAAPAPARNSYPAVASVTLAYPSSELKPVHRGSLAGFGHLIPRTQGVRTLGAIWSSSLFPERAPEGQTMVLSYIGGSRDPALGELPEEQIVQIVDADLKRVLLKDGTTIKPTVLGCKVWPKAIPQYEKGHGAVLAAIEAFEAKNPGLFLGGNYRTGVAFGDCVAFGADEAARIAKALPGLAAPLRTSPAASQDRQKAGAKRSN